MQICALGRRRGDADNVIRVKSQFQGSRSKPLKRVAVALQELKSDKDAAEADIEKEAAVVASAPLPRLSKTPCHPVGCSSATAAVP